MEFVSFFGNLPPGIVYFGTRIVCFLALFLIAAMVYIQSKSFIKAILSWSASYCALFFMGAFPTVFTWISFLFIPGKKTVNINSADIIQFTGAPMPIFGTVFNDLSYAMAYNLNLVFFPFFLGLLLCLFLFSNRKGAFSFQVQFLEKMILK